MKRYYIIAVSCRLFCKFGLCCLESAGFLRFCAPTHVYVSLQLFIKWYVWDLNFFFLFYSRKMFYKSYLVWFVWSELLSLILKYHIFVLLTEALSHFFLYFFIDWTFLLGCQRLNPAGKLVRKREVGQKWNLQNLLQQKWLEHPSLATTIFLMQKTMLASAPLLWQWNPLCHRPWSAAAKRKCLICLVRIQFSFVSFKTIVLSQILFLPLGLDLLQINGKRISWLQH